MIRAAWFSATLVLAASCGKDETKKKADEADSAGDTDSGDTGLVDDTSGDDSAIQWEPARIRPGTYTMTVSNTQTSECGDGLGDGTTESVEAVLDGQFVKMWGFAKVETDGAVLRVGGRLEEASSSYDCISTIQVTGEGAQQNEFSFTANITRRYQGEGTQCAEATGKSVPCIQIFRGAFELVPEAR